VDEFPVLAKGCYWFDSFLFSGVRRFFFKHNFNFSSFDLLAWTCFILVPFITLNFIICSFKKKLSCGGLAPFPITVRIRFYWRCSACVLTEPDIWGFCMVTSEAVYCGLQRTCPDPRIWNNFFASPQPGIVQIPVHSINKGLSRVMVSQG
jgi:hypothetical protein